MYKLLRPKPGSKLEVEKYVKNFAMPGKVLVSMQYSNTDIIYRYINY